MEYNSLRLRSTLFLLSVIYYKIFIGTYVSLLKSSTIANTEMATA